MADLDNLPDALVQALRKFAFDAIGGPAEDIEAATLRLFRRVRSRFGRRLSALVEAVASGSEPAETAAAEVAVMVLRDFYLKRLPDQTDEVKAHLKETLTELQGSERESFAAALRVVAEMTEDGDRDRAAPVFGKVDAASGRREPDGSATPGNGGAPAMETYDSILQALDEVFAFDEAKLPERLRYTTAANGHSNNAQVLSEGQLNFLRGVIEAVGKLGVRIPLQPAANNGSDIEQGRVLAAAVIGLLLLDGHHNPDDRSFFDHVTAAVIELMEPASSIRKEMEPGDDRFQAGFDQKHVVFRAVGNLLLTERRGSKIFFDAFAAVGRGMAGSYDTRPPNSAGFAPAVLARYNDETLAAGGGGQGGGSGIAFLDLPPLNDPSGEGSEIVPENIAAIAAIFVVYQCEQMMLFRVADRVVELFMAGLYPMAGDVLARKLDDYYWNREDQVSEAGRAAQFARALGAPGGDVGPDAPRNAEFNTHLMRCISTIAAVQSEKSFANLFDQNGANTTLTKGEYARKAMRDWAANCTLFGYAGAQFAAERLGRQLRRAMEILQLPRIKEIYGVNTMWQVIERVAQSEFGIMVNVVKNRTLAEEVRVIMSILADKHSVWSQSSGLPLFTVNKEAGDLDEVTSNRLFRAAQYCLAVNGRSDASMREYSQPIETPALPSVPAFGMFGGGGTGMNGGGAGGDIAGQIKDLLGRGVAPSPEQLKSIIGVV